MSLRKYELMVILDADVDERSVEKSLSTYLNNTIVADGGSIDAIDVWGKRRLAYEINKKSEGVYAVIGLSAGPDSVKELDRQLSLNESVVRTKVTRPDVK
ncbi:30S ribosomal protein S6 [Aeromicrobium flavum]|uniref:Small ribosomal subunit protein bS6 n=1 Tax=Aeromicrobium flavum TaxID=416568 RepID=A0A512HY57_9ACTN|nr:30S ribosomal protein S6 [Aeromicrobium flavum]